MLSDNKYVLDKYEMYSFTIYLYFYGFFYLYIFKQPILVAIFLASFSDIIIYYFLKYTFISLLFHSYWKNNFNTIAMPQLLLCLTNIFIYNYNYTYIINIPIHILLGICINTVYYNEIIESKNLRYIILGLSLFIQNFIFC
jgi:hypothetical protein